MIRKCASLIMIFLCAVVLILSENNVMFDVLGQTMPDPDHFTLRPIPTDSPTPEPIRAIGTSDLYTIPPVVPFLSTPRLPYLDTIVRSLVALGYTCFYQDVNVNPILVFCRYSRGSQAVSTVTIAGNNPVNVWYIDVNVSHDSTLSGFESANRLLTSIATIPVGGNDATNARAFISRAIRGPRQQLDYGDTEIIGSIPYTIVGKFGNWRLRIGVPSP